MPPTSRRPARAAIVIAAACSSVLAACGNASTPVSARQSAVRSSSNDVAFKNCASNCTGEIDGAKYRIALPSKWNGTLLLYSHGYRFASPIPAEPGSAVQTNAQVSSTDADGSASDPLSRKLLGEGYALAGSSYKSNGWAVADGVDAGVALHKKFVELVGNPKRTYVWGDSLGGLITEILAEENPSWVDGSAPMCGVLAGPNMNFDLALDVAFLIKALIDPSLKLTNYASADEANQNWVSAAALVKKAAADLAGGGTAAILYIAALVGAPAKTQTYDGHDIVSQVKATVDALLTALAFGTSGRYEVEQRVGGNPSDNTKADYVSRLTPKENLTITALHGDIGSFEQKINTLPRVHADAAARTAFEKLGDTTGDLHVPTVTMHTEDDPLVLVQNETVFDQRAEQRGEAARLVQTFIAPPATYSESSGAPYGAGHCNFSDQQRVGLVNVLDNWARRSAYPGTGAIASAFGAGYDPQFVPGPWPGSGQS
ncbi:MAG: hypothetical protein ACR2LF_04315 [Jatrophihabitantaceae bacterium]